MRRIVYVIPTAVRYCPHFVIERSFCMLSNPTPPFKPFGRSSTTGPQETVVTHNLSTPGGTTRLGAHRRHWRRRSGRHRRHSGRWLRRRRQRRRAGYERPRENDADEPSIHGIDSSLLISQSNLQTFGTQRHAASNAALACLVFRRKRKPALPARVITKGGSAAASGNLRIKTHERHRSAIAANRRGRNGPNIRTRAARNSAGRVAGARAVRCGH